MSVAVFLAAAAMAQAQPVPDAGTVPTPPPPTAEAGAPPETSAAPEAAVRRDPVSATPEAGREGVTTYPREYFNQYAPNSALDIIQRVPGFQFDAGAGNDVRGLAGSTGNVLIDGSRPASKTDNIESQLLRINANTIERVELIRGGAPGIDMQGRSVVVNVIRKRVDSLQQSATVRVEHFTEDGRFLPGYRYELTRQSGERTFELGLGRFIGYDDSTGTGFRRRRDPLGVVIRDEIVTNESDGYTHQATASYKTPLMGGVLRVNGLANINDFKDEAHFDGSDGKLDVVNRSDDSNQEFGGTYTRDFGTRWSAELLGLYTARKSEFRSASEGYGAADCYRFRGEDDTGERIGRLTLKHRWSDRLSFEAGGETAFNFLEGAVALEENGVPIPLPSANVRVEEDRSELFALANWRPRTDLTVEAGFRFERSTIRQIGDNAREREFQYPKPRLLATWTPDPKTTLRFRAEREVGQLDFGDFVSEANLTTGVVAAGNPNLEPDKIWVAELTGEQRFWDTGSLAVTLRHEEVTDVVDRIPVTTTDETTGEVSVFEAPGNIGEGTGDELEINLTLPLKRLGLTGAELKIAAEWRNSEVVDPTTGESRRISGQRPDEIEVNYRHDFPRQKLTFNAVYFDGWKETYYNFNQVARFDLSEFTEASLEYRPRPNTFMSVALSNFTAFDFRRTREVYTGRRDTQPLLFTEERENESQLRVIFRLRQTFGA